MVKFEGYEDAIRRVYDNGQERVFDEWDTLTDTEKKSLLTELSQVDFDLMKKLFREKDLSVHQDYAPAPYIRIPRGDAEKKKFAEATEAGREYIRQGKVAAFMVAGGQGSRLGYDGPKGKFPIGPVSGKTLFQIHAEKILKYSKKYNVPIPFLIMTSDENHKDTVAFFEEHKNFGIPGKDLIIFPQNMIPSLDCDGNLVLKEKSCLFRNPDGHGGSLTAMNTSGALKDLAGRGIGLISYFQVDNPLANIIDPAFIGYHVQNAADISSKAIKKAYPEEKLGVFVKFTNSRYGVIEYSDLPADKMNLRDKSGELAYIAGSIAIHLFSREFVERVTAGLEISLPFHTANKKLKVYERGSIREIGGLKFEKFVFDALPLTEKNIIFETVREQEFAPVKNPNGVDSVESCQKLMSDLYRSWLAARRIKVSAAAKVVEISPLSAVEPEDLDPSQKIPETEKVYLE